MRRTIATVLVAVSLCVLSGCRLLVGTTAVAVGAVGLVGYGVYKTGEAVVTGVGSAVSCVTGGGRSVVFVDGEFKAEGEGSVDEVWLASAGVLKENGFLSVSGNRDALSGHLEAVSWNKEAITVKVRAMGQGQTEIRIRIGVDGDLMKSETLYNLIITELSLRRENQRKGGL